MIIYYVFLRYIIKKKTDRNLESMSIIENSCQSFVESS